MIVVAAGIVFRGDRDDPRTVLVTRRKKGAHLEGLWEFPGGKVDADEDPRAALVRELREELGIDAVAGDILEATFHRYEDAGKSVLLLFYEARLAPGSPEPTAIDVAELRFATAADLDRLAFPPADVPVLAKVRARLSEG